MILAVPTAGAAPEDPIETVIALQVDSGGVVPGRDSRIFNVPVRCNEKDARFIWACGGWTMISESFARECGLRIKPDDETAGILDGAGQRIFAGMADAKIIFGERAHKVEAKVMRDAEYTQGTVGVIGFDIASSFQWEMNPDAQKPTLTLRPPGTPLARGKLAREPLAVLPLQHDRLNVWINVKIRNVAEDVMLLPQNSDTQAGPELQRRWDLAKGTLEDAKAAEGTIRTLGLGRDAVELSKEVRETDVRMMMVGDPKNPEATPHARSGLGQSFLNRFVYCVDPKRKEFVILARMGSGPATRPAGAVKK